MASQNTDTQASLVELLKQHVKSTGWNSPESSQYDFRSDVITVPSLSMLAAMISTTLGDDVFREDTTTIDFEKHMASLCGQGAGLFAITGTMANQLALRGLLTQPPHGILTDGHAHIVIYEAGGPSFMSGAVLQTVTPTNGKYLTLEDIKQNATLTDNVHFVPTRVVALENTISGVIVPLEEMRRISRWCRENEVKLHMDGARLFEAVAAGAGSLREYCELCDTVTLDFSKDLGAPMGAMVLGSAATINQTRRIRKSIGGGLRQAGVASAACRKALEEQFGPGEWGQTGKLRKVHEMAKEVGEMWKQRGGKLSKEIQTNQVWLDIEKNGIQQDQLNKVGEKFGVKLDGPRLVLHHQISDDALERLGKVFGELLQPRARL